MNINNIITIVDTALPYILIFIFILYALTSEVSLRYITRNMASSAKTITKTFKDQGMDGAKVEGTVSLGFLSFKVIAKDEV